MTVMLKHRSLWSPVSSLSEISNISKDIWYRKVNKVLLHRREQINIYLWFTCSRLDVANRCQCICNQNWTWEGKKLQWMWIVKCEAIVGDLALTQWIPASPCKFLVCCSHQRQHEGMVRSKNHVRIWDKIPRHRDNVLQIICFEQRYCVQIRILSTISAN